MIFSLNKLIDADPCQDGLDRLLRTILCDFPGDIPVDNLKRLNMKVDTSRFTDDELNKKITERDLSWFIKRFDIAVPRISNISEHNKYNYAKNFTKNPSCVAMGFFTRSYNEYRFQDGKIVDFSFYKEIEEDRADYYSMVLTEKGEWCYYPAYKKMEEEFSKNAEEEFYQDKKHYKAKY